MCPPSSSTGTVSAKVSEPCSRRVSISGASGARWSQNSVDPPAKLKVSSTGSPLPVASVTRIVRPGTRNAVCRARAATSSKEIVASGRKICRSGQNRTRVPVTRLATRRTVVSPEPGTNFAVGRGPSKAPGVPRRKLIAWVAPSRSTSTSSREESALTTDAPTPCRPPVAAYELPPNLPPACSFVSTTSTPDSPVRGSVSTGMPRPLSRTSHDPSACSSTSMFEQCPPSASSTALSMISHRQCTRPRLSVDPTYMPGRLRTASRPSSTSRWRAVYPAPTGVAVAVLEAVTRQNLPVATDTCGTPRHASEGARGTKCGTQETPAP